jgi:hypothetical protein
MEKAGYAIPPRKSKVGAALDRMNAADKRRSKADKRRSKTGGAKMSRRKKSPRGENVRNGIEGG